MTPVSVRPPRPRVDRGAGCLSPHAVARARRLGEPGAPEGLADRHRRCGGDDGRDAARARAGRRGDRGGDDRRRGRAGRHRGAFHSRRADRRAGRHHPARAREHPHARGDGDVQGPGRRPRADGLAAAVHLPGRGADGVARHGADRDAAGRARDDPVGDHDLRRHVLLRGGGGARHPRGRPARRARPDDHRLPGGGREDRRPRGWPAPRRSSRPSTATR